MLIKSAEFITSAVRPQQYPAPDLPEFAFAGRSTWQVQPESTPGHRRSLSKPAPSRQDPADQLFRVNEAFMLVDLPGYGMRGV